MEKNVIQIKWWNNLKCLCECRKRHGCEKDYIWNLVTCSCQNGKYLAIIMVDSAITCDEIIIDAEAKLNNKVVKTFRSFNEKKVTCKTHNFYILLKFLKIFIALLLAVTIYCYLIKYWAKTAFDSISRHKQRIKRSRILINILWTLKVIIN